MLAGTLIKYLDVYVTKGGKVLPVRSAFVPVEMIPSPTGWTKFSLLTVSAPRVPEESTSPLKDNRLHLSLMMHQKRLFIII